MPTSGEDSQFVAHAACEACGSSDANAIYDDGHTHCFSCGVSKRSDKSTTTRKPRVSTDLIRGDVRALPKRGITEETCKHWHYECGEYNGKPVQIANYCDASGTPVAQKIRFPGKEFIVTGDLKKAGLFGQHLWRDGGKMVVVTEGEIDALSVSQLQQNRWPVVSVPNGAQGAPKAIRGASEWLEKFDKVVFLFDDDEPGRAATQVCAPLLSPGKAFTARIAGFKDANEALTAGAGAKVIDAIWGARAYRPDGVVDVASLTEQALAPIAIGIPWPWKSLTERTYGIRRRELYGFGAGTGVGKSDVFKEIAVHLLSLPLDLKVGYVALEEHPAMSLKQLAGKSINQRLHVPGVDVPIEVQQRAIAALDGRIFFYNHFGAATYETIKAKIRYMVQALGCRDIFLDHLTALAAAVDSDERKAIDLIMADLSSLTQELDCTIYYISHLTTPEGKSHEEGGRVMEKHFRGSRSIAYWSHFLFGLERDKQDPDAPTTFRVLKDRYTGDSAGLMFGLRYDRQTGRTYECALPESGGGFKDETGGEF